jgi:hypothetical protein
MEFRSASLSESKMKDSQLVRRRTLSLLALLDQIEEPEKPAMAVLMDAVQIVEAYRDARHQVLGLQELTHSVDALIRELEISERINQWIAEDQEAEPLAIHPA